MKIVVTGDSYTYGEGCSDVIVGPDRRLLPSKYCWVSLLEQNHTNVNVQNFSRPGLDNVSIAQFLWENVDANTDVVLFCGTFYSRMCAGHPDAPEHTIIPITPHFQHLEQKQLKDFGLAVDQYYRHLYSDQVGYNISTSALLSAYACAVLNGAKFFWSMPTQPFDGIINPVVDKLSHLRFTAISDIDYDKHCIAPCRHPNNQGHEIYYNRVISDLVKIFKLKGQPSGH